MTWIILLMYLEIISPFAIDGAGGSRARYMDRFDSTLIPPTSRQVVDAVLCHLEPRVYKSRRIRIAGAGRERCREDYLIERSNHPCFTLELVVSGKGTLELGGAKLALLPGHLFLYGPGIRFTMRTDPHAPMLKYFVEFFGGRPAELFHSGIIQPGEVRRLTDIEHLSELCDRLIAAGRGRSPHQQAICEAYLRLLLIKTTEATSHDRKSSVQLLENLERCRSLIEKNCHDIFNLRTLSRLAHLDASYICRLFKQFKLPSPHRYLNQCRMNRAVEILLTTDRPIKWVAASVGYLDPLHFSRNFRRQFGCSPRDFRETSVNRRSPRVSGSAREKV